MYIKLALTSNCDVAPSAFKYIEGFKDIAVYAESYVTINGRPSQLYIDPKINLYNKNRSLKNKEWIMPFKYDIKRFL